MAFINVTPITDSRTKEKGSRVARIDDINEHTRVAKPQLSGRSRCRWDDNIKIDLEEICRVIEWRSTGRGWIPEIGLCECDTKNVGFANCKDIGDQLSDGSFHGIPCNVKLIKGCHYHLRRNAS